VASARDLRRGPLLTPKELEKSLKRRYCALVSTANIPESADVIASKGDREEVAASAVNNRPPYEKVDAPGLTPSSWSASPVDFRVLSFYAGRYLDVGQHEE
jgi:hypothetical protein